MTFNFLDIVFLVIMFFLAIHGTIVGFVKEFFSKVAIVLGVFISVVFYARLSPYLNRHIESDFVSKIVAFLLLFVLVYLIVRLIQHFVGSFFEGDILAGLDRTLGFFFGAAEGLLIVCIVLIIFYAQPWFDIGPLVQESYFHKTLNSLLAEPVGMVQDFIALSSIKHTGV